MTRRPIAERRVGSIRPSPRSPLRADALLGLGNRPARKKQADYDSARGGAERGAILIWARAGIYPPPNAGDPLNLKSGVRARARGRGSLERPAQPRVGGAALFFTRVGGRREAPRRAPLRSARASPGRNATGSRRDGARRARG